MADKQVSTGDGNVKIPSAGEATPTPSKRDAFKRRLSEKYPDKNFDDEEAMFGQISDDYDSTESELNRYREDERKLTDMFNADERNAALFADFANGGDPRLTLIKLYGKDVGDMANDPEKQEEVAAANREYVERVAKEKSLEEEYKKNLDDSLQAADDWQKKNNLTDEQVDEAFQFIVQIASDAIVGKFTEESLDLARKSITHDMDVQEAGNAGEIRGRNAKIDMKLKKSKNSDGVPSLGGKSRGASKSQSSPDLGALDTIASRGSIWDSDEKRTKFK